MPSAEYEFRDIGRLGIVTDEHPDRLDRRALAAGENFILRDGVPSAIGVLPTITAPGGGLSYKSVIQTMSTDIPKLHVWRSDGAFLDVVTTTNLMSPAASEKPEGGEALLPLIEYGGETLWFPQDGISPITRWAGAADTVFSTGNVTSLARGGTVATWITDTYAGPDAGVYLSANSVTEAAPRSLRIVRVTANFAQMNDTYEGVESANTLHFRGYGVLGLCAPVRMARGTTSAGVFSVVSPYNLTFALAGNAVRNGDYVGVVSGATGVASVAGVTAGNANLVNGSTSAGPDDYQFMRPMPGTCGALHRGRLYTSGILWMRNSVFIFPQGYRFGDVYNGIDSPTTDKSAARMAKFIDVPDTRGLGKVVALMSTPSYLLVLRDRDIYALSGEYPTTSVNLLSPEDGCIDIRSAIQTRYGQVWAGKHGIYRHDRGGISNLVDGRRQEEWRAQVAAISDIDSPPSVACTTIGRHLLVTSMSNSGSLAQTWCYDFDNRAWVGDIPNLLARVYSPNGASPSTGAGNPVSVAWVSSTNDGGIGTYAEKSLDEPDANIEQMVLETGAIKGLGQNDRLTNIKASYEIESADGAATLTFQARVGGAAWATLAGLTVASDGASTGAPITRRMRATGSFTTLSPTPAPTIGAEGNAVRLRISGPGAVVATDLRLHSMTAIARVRGRRA